MRLSGLFRREPEASDGYTALEATLADALLDEDMSGSPGNEPDAPAGDAEPDPAVPAITQYAQARLAETAAYEGMQDAAAADLDAISVAVAQIRIAQRQTREFVNGVYTAAHRLSELETANTKLLAENRTLFRQAEYVNRLRSQQEGLVDGFRQREEKLAEAADAARRDLAAVRLELVATQTQVAAHANERHHLQKSLNAALGEAERTMRENEVLRERLASLTADLEAAGRRRVETERRLDEVAALQTRDAADNAELREHVSAVEAERQHLFKQLESLQAKHAETTEALKVSEAETHDQSRRYDIGLVTLRNERDTLAARLEHAEKAQAESAVKVAALTVALDDALTRRRLIDTAPPVPEPMRAASRTDVVVERRAVGKVRAQVAERVATDLDRAGPERTGAAV